jgi:tetratricopeptide (TPR) repeat protein
MHVAEVLNSLAEVYHDQEKYAEAEPLYWRAVEIIQENMGHDHPTVAKALRRLAHLYEEQENFSEADRLYRWGLGVSEKALRGRASGGGRT